MAQKIIQLDTKTINQIAAGEVVENPSSVVKELVENSIDAGAKKIVVEVVDGGFSLIKIVDDGQGFEKEDLEICLGRHTTSKLRSIEDLWKIHSMGFRGEALASIASISELSILTKSKELSLHEPGFFLINHPQQEISVYPREYGTTIEVKSLFYNVPARKAFQKTSAQSLAEIIKVMTKACLAFPHLNMQLIAQGKNVFSHRGEKKETFIESLSSAIEETLDPSFLKNSYVINESYEGVQFRGILGGFEQTRSNRLGQHLFINQRPVFSPLISQVIKNAYGTRIDSQMHPIFVLHIDLPPSIVDVNVHPQKKEVRIKEEKELCEKLKRAVIKSLLQIPQEKIDLIESAHIFTQPTKAPFSSPSTPSFRSFSSAKPSFEPKFQSWSSEKIFIEESKKEAIYPERTAISILGKVYHYLIVQAEDIEFLDLPLKEPVVLINTKALKNRLHYEQMKKSLIKSKERPIMQSLLFPIQLEYSLQESLKIEKNIEVFPFLGIEIVQIGPRVFSVNSLLEGIQEDEVKEWIEIILQDVERIQEEEIQMNLLKKLSKKMRSSHENLSEGKLYHLLKELMNYEERLYSSSGEKIFHALSSSQMDKLCQ
jgi:DNA mismatch repair protein MutL